MPPTRTSSRMAEITPAQRRDETIAILATGLVRLIQASQPQSGTPIDRLGSMPADTLAAAPVDALTSMPDEKLSESGENGLELSDTTRLSVPAG